MLPNLPTQADTSLYTLTCTRTGETQEVVVCFTCATQMPLVNNDTVRSTSADPGCSCEFCR